MKVYVKGQNPINLGKKEYKAAGGEGAIYCKGKLAYKIYKDAGCLIPVQKIEELKQIQIKNVLAPIDILYNYGNNKPIGFTMPFIKDTEFLCKLFTRSFRDRNSISPQQILELVKNMQSTLAGVHAKHCLVVDFNEMNFLVDNRTYADSYFIDVNSYQTPNFPATALMESVRDRLSEKGKFSEYTDWFSFAVVTFQLYMGVHPYKGRHPDYKPKDIATLKMMDDNVSVFHKDVRLPATSQDWAAIPKPHFEWYKKVFLDGERTVPPMPDAIGHVSVSEPKVVFGTDQFVVELVDTYKANIKSVYHFNGVRYVLAGKSIYEGKNEVAKSSGQFTRSELCNIAGESPVVCEFYKVSNQIIFRDFRGVAIGGASADDMMALNGFIYTTHNGKLIENSFIKVNKLIHKTKVICDIFELSHKVFKGVVVQDILEKCWVAIPYKPGACANIHIKELDGYRIIDAKYDSGHKTNVCVLLVEKSGDYSRVTLCFDSRFSSYTIRVEANVLMDSVNFTVLANGVCVEVINDLKVEAFLDNDQVKIIDNPPFDSGMKMVTDGSKAMFADRNKLYKVGLK